MDNQDQINPWGEKEKTTPNIPVSPNLTPPPPDLSTTPMPQQPKKNFFFEGEEKKIEPMAEKTPTPEATSIKPAFQVGGETAPKAPMKERAAFVIPTVSSGFKRWIPGVITGLALLAIVGVGIYYFVFTKKEAPVTIAANQTGINLTIDGVRYENVATPYKISLATGSHQVLAQKDGFIDMAKSIEIASSTKAYTLSFDLQANPVPANVLTKEILFPDYDKDRNILHYFIKNESDKHNLVEYDLAQQTETVLIENIGEITKVSWSPSHRQLAVKVINSAQNQDSPLGFLGEYGEGTRVNWVINLNRPDLVNVGTKSLHPSLKNITFNPTGTKIAYLFQNSTEKNLSIANIDGANFEKIGDFKTIDFEPDVTWSPDASEIAYFANQENGASSKAESIDVSVYNFQTKSVTKVSNDGVSYGAVFSPDNRYLSYISGNNLVIFDLTNKNQDYNGIKTQARTSLGNIVWWDNQTMIVLASDRNLYKVSVAGSQEKINFDNSSVSGNIRNLLLGGKESVLIIADSGVYEVMVNY